MKWIFGSQTRHSRTDPPTTGTLISGIIIQVEQQVFLKLKVEATSVPLPPLPPPPMPVANTQFRRILPVSLCPSSRDLRKGPFWEEIMKEQKAFNHHFFMVYSMQVVLKLLLVPTSTVPYPFGDGNITISLGFTINFDRLFGRDK